MGESELNVKIDNNHYFCGYDRSNQNAQLLSSSGFTLVLTPLNNNRAQRVSLKYYVFANISNRTLKWTPTAEYRMVNTLFWWKSSVNMHITLAVWQLSVQSHTDYKQVIWLYITRWHILASHVFHTLSWQPECGPLF